MIITSYRTDPIVKGSSLFGILDTFLPSLQERDIVVITSKIVSICEGNVVPTTDALHKRTLVREHSEEYIDNGLTKRYGYQLTIAHNICIPNAGIDESNGNGYTILWPNDPMASATGIWHHIKNTYGLRHIGIIITDSHTTMLRKGTSGIGLSWCGFEPLVDYVGKPDIFGRLLQMTQANIVDGFSAAAVSVMGEGNEQTPLAVIRETQNVIFSDHPPTEKEIANVTIPMDQDLYAPLLMSTPWEKGGRS